MSGLPIGLRIYRLFSAAAGPLAPILLAQRAKRGKEIRQRLPERRGESRIAPAGWPPGLAAWCERWRAGERASTDRTNSRTRHRHAGHHRHRHLGRPRRAAPAARRGASIRSARCAALRASLSQPLAARSRLVRRIRFVAEHHDRGIGPRHSDGLGQRPPVGKLVPAVAPATELDRRSVATARPLPCGHGVRRRSIKGARRRTGGEYRQSQARRPRTTGRFRGPRSACRMRSANGQ